MNDQSKFPKIEHTDCDCDRCHADRQTCRIGELEQQLAVVQGECSKEYRRGKADQKRAATRASSWQSSEEIKALRDRLAAAEAERDKQQNVFLGAMAARDRQLIEFGELVNERGLQINRLTAERDALERIHALDSALQAEMRIGRDQLISERDRLAEIVAKLRSGLDKIVVADGIDAGVILLSDDSPTHWNDTVKGQVYDYENFSPLGDALVALAKLAKMASGEKP